MAAPAPVSHPGTGSRSRTGAHSASFMSEPYRGRRSGRSDAFPKTVTPRSGQTGLGNRDHATLRQQGLLLLAGLDIRELPRGPSFMPPHRPTHPIQDSVRSGPIARTDREQPVRSRPTLINLMRKGFE
jgi:hypothetical protein